ncbi:unnamed protein product [Ophioblennius macclurei]
MASILASPHDELLCPVCREIYTDPVVLKCSHSFCRTCVTQWWKTKGHRECPFCKATCSRTPLIRNLVLKNVCDAFQLEMDSGVICKDHHEKFKMYCMDDRVPLCVVCSRSAQHRDHKCVPADEAADRRRCELVQYLPALRDRLKDFKAAKDRCEGVDVKNQSQATQDKIREEFDILRDFLRVEQEIRIGAVKEEEALEMNKINEVSREVASLESTINTIEDGLKKDDASFLLEADEMIRKAQHPLPELNETKPIGVDVAKHLGNVGFNAWYKMQGIVSCSPVILNLSTAHQELELSEDLTSVRCVTEVTQNIFATKPEMKHHCVLGWQGFTSGTHFWDVLVENNPVWALGVSTQEVQKNVDIQSGLWMLRFCKGKFTAYSLPGVVSALPSREPLPKRVRVLLNYNNGVLAFLDPDSQTVIHVFRTKFTEKLFPYINTWEGVPLKILPLKHSVIMTYSL